ncbi:MAG: hypothetical protein PHI85_05315 [Victivallaceae bacterium]|nr:hypothetical protein [Victivallaceae bacterium]
MPVKKLRDGDGGFNAVEAEFCLLCGHELPEAVHAESPSAADTADARRALGDLLGGETSAPKPKFEAAPDEKRFCRDCVWFVSHPFISRCEKFHRAADPMGDCASFSIRKEEKSHDPFGDKTRKS